MSTRSMTIIRSRHENDECKTLVTIYRHNDGYPSGHGVDLFNILNGLVIVNGITEDTPRKYINGPGRLAAQIVYELQQKGCNPSLVFAGAVSGQEYTYEISVQSHGVFCVYNQPIITVYAGPMTFFGYGGEKCTEIIFTGTVEEYGIWLMEEN